MFRKILMAFFLVAVAGCTKGADISTPQGVLRDYVSQFFTVKAAKDLEELKKHTTGEAEAALDKLEKDSEAFQKAFVDDKNTFVSMRVRDERKVGEDRYSITYELNYK